MKNPLESLHKTIGMGVILTAIMVLIIAIFYWESSEATAPAAKDAPAASEKPAASETPAAGEKPAADAAGAATDAAAGTNN